MKKSTATQPNKSTDSRPNIIVILADDMGYSDIGCYGSEVNTPNLNRMAQSGVRFTQMYNMARCCPSRATLLTGLYPHQAGVGHMVRDRGFPAYQGYLNNNCVTIAEALKAGGYSTYMSGKWHVGGHYNPDEPEKWRPGSQGFPTPLQRGFDHHFGTLNGAGSFFTPPTLVEDDSFIKPDGTYYTDAITDNAVEMISAGAEKENPFFLYVAYTAPHWPLHALEEDIAKYDGKYRHGWDPIRTARHEELKGMGILDSKWDISPRDEESPDWDGLPRDRREWEALRMAVYAAQIDRMDQGIGRIMRQLEQLNIADNTLVMFMSDNGGCAEFLAEDGHAQNFNVPTYDGRPVQVGNIPSLRPGPDDTFMSYDLPWANASNTPFRLYKHWVHEGGISTPFIAHWPEKVSAGSIVHSPAHFIDIMATCLDAAGQQYPQEHNGHSITPLQGESLVAAFQGNSWERERPIVLEHEGNRAVRAGNWKLVSKHPGNWELYNMDDDRTELNDLTERNVPKVTELQGIYQEWANRCDVIPWGDFRRLRQQRQK